VLNSVGGLVSGMLDWVDLVGEKHLLGYLFMCGQKCCCLLPG
jgi:hypothetical protein